MKNNGKRLGGGPNGPALGIPKGFAQNQMIRSGGKIAPPKNAVIVKSLAKSNTVKTKT